MEMSMGFLFLVMAVVARTAATQPVLTIMSPDGDIVDCININDQPAFDHPLLRNHTVLEAPAYLPDIDDTSWQVWHGNGTECPKRTIPVRQLNRTTGSQPGQEATLGHEYAIGTLDSPPGPPSKIYGAKATFNVWRPKVEQATEFSLAQIWIISGSYDNNTLNSIEAGWQTDAYTSTMCYYLRCPGFVQTSRTVLIEGAISPASTIGGLQTELTIQVWKDPARGPWWLGVGFSNGTKLSAIGYWPRSSTSGHRGDIRLLRWVLVTVPAAIETHVRDLQVALSPGEFVPVSRLIVGATNATYYSVEKYSNNSFSYGGPHGTAVHLRVRFLAEYLQ
uniref:Neprosin PEP catalytic domain-containing protein n=1 Tax=Brassica oleracea var. oleracea TaxID=109376 RepID=A0A0D3BD17_BRAOL